MTTLEALQAMIELDNDNLLAKALADRSLNGTETYSATYTVSVELACADVCDALLAYPDFSEGGLSIRFDKAGLTALRDKLYAKHGVTGGKPSMTALSDPSLRLW